MHIRFKTNLGSRDASRCGLDFRECLAGATAEVKEAAGNWLINRGIAESVSQKPKAVTGAAPRPAIAESQPPEIKTTSSPGPKAGAKQKEN